MTNFVRQFMVRLFTAKSVNSGLEARLCITACKRLQFMYGVFFVRTDCGPCMETSGSAGFRRCAPVFQPCVARFFYA